MSDNMFDFGGGLVPAHRHPNGGGWVANTAFVADSARVYGNAQVAGNAQVSGNAQVAGNALVYGVMRSDGYCFVPVMCTDGNPRVIAGCRYFTYDEAVAHWSKTRGGTPLGDETFAILEFFKATGKL